MTNRSKIKVLVVDDTRFMRKAVSRFLSSDADIEVVAAARNGLESLDMIRNLEPDVITLDIDMPVMDGLTAIKHIMIRKPVPIVVLSSMVADGIVTFEALRLGVMDFVPKPSGAISTDIDKTKHQVISRVKIACSMTLKNVRRVRLPKKWDMGRRLDELYHFYPLDYVVVIGTTLSGPNTVIRLLSKLSPTLPAAIVVLQEISPKIIESFTNQFNRYVPWRVDMARDRTVLEQGGCYICSNENSLTFEMNETGDICLRVGDATDYPLDLFFSSAARIFHQNTVGILLSGVGNDGADGFSDIKRASGTTMAKAEECCVFPNLTENAIRKGVVDIILNDDKLSGAIEAVIRNAQ